ncbi:MAG: histidine--tRNA ligase [Candidatus Dojkabacteria bacterium]|nr:MAG: histidine--tRNA ligase [Candidatus Dojkabacteria bacterium]
MKTTISNEPYKGTADWTPSEFKIRKYIFDSWRSVCTKFGYQEYLTPLLEFADLYRAKSGEDLGGKELMIVIDRSGRELAIRPEMTPSVTRMVSRSYEGEAKPIKLFSIANFMRGEKPQRGRNREFWQLNFDIFGENSINADIEILQVALEIMLSFNPPDGAFTLFVNNRKLIDAVLNRFAQVTPEQRGEVVRILDKWEKEEQSSLIERLTQIGLNEAQIAALRAFMDSKSEQELLTNIPQIDSEEGYLEMRQIIGKLTALGYEKWVKFQPNVIRGFDYYDGMVFEVFDNNPENNRSMFGGGRYNGLAELFGVNSFPATGCAPGDETTKLFLESWGLLGNIQFDDPTDRYYVPLLDEKFYDEVNRIAAKLRSEGKVVETGFEVEGVGKALKYGNSKNFGNVVIYGDFEAEKGVYKVKDMASGEEREVSLAE